MKDETVKPDTVYIYLKLKLSVKKSNLDKNKFRNIQPCDSYAYCVSGYERLILLHVSITALLTQIEVKWPLKQLSIAPHAPSRIGCCCDCMGFYSIRCSLHTYRIIFTLLLHPIYCSVATLAQHSGVFGYRSFQCS